MPLYVYECVNCAARKELIRSFACADDDERCDKCFEEEPGLQMEGKKERSKMQRVLYPGGHKVHFGKGFFKTGGYIFLFFLLSGCGRDVTSFYFKKYCRIQPDNSVKCYFDRSEE